MSKRQRQDGAVAAREAAIHQVCANTVLASVAEYVRFTPDVDHRHVAPHGWLAVSPMGVIWLHPKRRAEPQAWARLMAIALVSLGFGFVKKQEPMGTWEIACFLVADRFCDELKLGQLPDELLYPDIGIPYGGVDALVQQLRMNENFEVWSQWQRQLCGDASLFCNFDEQERRWCRRPKWSDLLGDGIARGVGHAIEAASGLQPSRIASRATRAQRAKQRLIDHYPLLGALAAGFDIEEDPRLCQQYDVRVAAIDVGARRIWMNPVAGLADDECLFVFAHELLHAGLNHASRRRGRDPLLWNIACDFTINGWLMEMGVGAPPNLGLLHDQQFAGKSSEEVYDTLAQDIRRARKLATLRGVGAQDLIGHDEGKLFTDAEAYCRRALAQGVERYGCSRRGTLPAGLVEEIRSLSQPPIPWDVRLSAWFDERFPPPELRRTYARPSRRQSTTPDFPRPSTAKPTEEECSSRVFGVLLDTSGSMEPKLLGKAVGAIASYALARDVSAVRLVCCDAHAYDMGWVAPENLLDRFSLRGRGGTVLQPGLDYLHDAARSGNFPKHGPLLIITDGDCEDYIATQMDHAYLLPEGRRLPFHTRSEIFFVD